VLLPWLTVGAFIYFTYVRPVLNEDGTETSLFWPIVAALVLAFGQVMRRSAIRQERGELPDRVARGFIKYPRTWWRRLSRRVGGLDLPAEEIRALWSVNFTAKRGMIGILGPNGAGKTTLLRQLAGIINPTRGAIKVGGVPLTAIQKVLARWVGYLPQDAGLPLSLTPRDYLQYYASLYDIAPEIRNERVASLIEEVGLAEKIDDKISSLSGGMKQRVAVARTLLRLPAIIIVDEPTVGLDPRERIRFRNLLARLSETRIVLFSTHVVEDVAISCERVLVIAKSRLRFDGSPSDLATNAEGRVWEKKIEQGQDKSLPVGAILAEEAPDASGATVQRIIWNERPSEDAKQLNPRPEDGYLWLLATS
jgi:ABC-type multidrug transport system ATPase subunit